MEKALAKLPYEILLKITELVKSDASKKDLQNLRLVNKQFSDIAGGLLFRELRINFDDVLHVSKTADLLQRTTHDRGYRNSGFLLQPRTVTAEINCAILQPSVATAAEALIPGFLDSLPKLTTLKILVSVMVSANRQVGLDTATPSFLRRICEYGSILNLSMHWQGTRPAIEILPHLSGLRELVMNAPLGGSILEIANVIRKSPRLVDCDLDGRDGELLDVEEIVFRVPDDQIPKGPRSLGMRNCSPPYTKASWMKLRGLKVLDISYAHWLDLEGRGAIWEHMRVVDVRLQELQVNIPSMGMVKYLSSPAGSRLTKLALRLAHRYFDKDTDQGRIQAMADEFYGGALVMIMSQLAYLDITLTHRHAHRRGDDGAAASGDRTNGFQLSAIWSLRAFAEHLDNLFPNNLVRLGIMDPLPSNLEPPNPKDMPILAAIWDKAPKLEHMILVFVSDRAPGCITLGDDDNTDSSDTRILNTYSMDRYAYDGPTASMRDGALLSVGQRVSSLSSVWNSVTKVLKWDLNEKLTIIGLEGGSRRGYRHYKSKDNMWIDYAVGQETEDSFLESWS